MDISGKAILVAGAGSGLGAAVAEGLAARGANIVGLDINPGPSSRPDATSGGEMLMIRADVTSAADGMAAVDAALARFGAVHGLVNCAGIAPSRRITGRDGPHDLDIFARTVAVSLNGTFNMLRLAAVAMEKNDPGPAGERGVIVNTASIAAFDGQIGQAAYAASKGGVVSLTLPAARELARLGIRVMVVAPGIFATPMVASLPSEVQESLGATVPFPSRLGKPGEFANLVAAIFANPMLNGEVIRLDGALRMAAK